MSAVSSPQKIKSAMGKVQELLKVQVSKLTANVDRKQDEAQIRLLSEDEKAVSPKKVPTPKSPAETDDEELKKPFFQRQEFLSGCSYCVMSAMMTILNKSVLSGHSFGCPTVLVCFQNVVSLALVLICRQVGVARQTPVTFSLLVDWSSVSFLFVGMIWTASLGLKYLNVPTMSVMKNINNFMIITAEYFLYGKVYAATVWFTIVLILVSAYCSAVTDLTFNYTGMFWQLMNCAFTAAYTLHLRSQLVSLKKQMDGKMDVYTSMLYKTLLAIPMLIGLATVTGELTDVQSDPALQDEQFWAIAWAGAWCSFLISVCATWFMTNTSATTFGIVSALSKVPACGFSILFMNTATSPRNLLSVAFGIGAGALFVWEKQRTTKKGSGGPAGAGAGGPPGAKSVGPKSVAT